MMKLTSEEKLQKLNQITKLRASGKTAQGACDEIGVSYSTYGYWLKTSRKAKKKVVAPVKRRVIPTLAPTLTRLPMAPPQSSDRLMVIIGSRSEVLALMDSFR